MELQTCRPVRMLYPQRIRSTCGCHAHLINLVLIFSTVLVNGNDALGAPTADDNKVENASDSSIAGNPIPQVRYRTRPVAAFRSGPKFTNNDNSSSDKIDSPEPSGVPFIAVHDLTSQTFERLQENWKNLEALIRNYQARRSREESLLSSSSPGGVISGGGSTTVRRPPYSNVYTLKYHPVLLEGDGSNSLDESAGGNSRGTSLRAVNGINFNPFPYDPKGEESKNVDMERHTVATIYTIGICLTIMAIGSIMFILINKCDGTSGSQYTRTSAMSMAGNRIARSVIGGARGGRQNSRNNNNNNGRSHRTRSGRSNDEAANSNVHTSDTAESVAKNLADLPPSYDSLFPEGGPKVQEIPNLALSTNSTSSVSVPPVILENSNSSSNNNIIDSSPSATTTTRVES